MGSLQPMLHLPAVPPMPILRPPRDGENESKDDPKPGCQRPRDTQGHSGLSLAPTQCPVLCFRPSQGLAPASPQGSVSGSP